MNNKPLKETNSHIAGEVTFLVGVSNDDHSRTASRFAALRASRSGGRVALLHVVEPPEFQHWAAVFDLMREETFEKANLLLEDISKEVISLTKVKPSLFVREGPIGEEVIAQIEEDKSINLLVVGAAPPAQGKGKLISWLASQLAGNLKIPLVIVPGDLTDEQLKELT
ncbi:MAG: universal stress protein [Rhodospirillaceae bacterium]|nr:universal stress protein [Alphaproteobacteria bacterium]MBR72863.1 universal stress protein [Rhodospirillaceae bacterium]|tara:strand:+ start:398 stop:901 length:504 start_codon:yes stop_codon:yes gene_type:complete